MPWVNNWTYHNDGDDDGDVEFDRNVFFLRLALNLCAVLNRRHPDGTVVNGGQHQHVNTVNSICEKFPSQQHLRIWFQNCAHSSQLQSNDLFHQPLNPLKWRKLQMQNFLSKTENLCSRLFCVAIQWSTSREIFVNTP